MARHDPNPREGMLKALLFHSATTPAQALWECRDKWGTVIMVAGRCEVYYRSRSATLLPAAFDLLVAVFADGYPCARRDIMALRRLADYSLDRLGIRLKVRDRCVTNGSDNTTPPRPYPRPPRMLPNTGWVKPRGPAWKRNVVRRIAP